MIAGTSNHRYTLELLESFAALRLQNFIQEVPALAATPLTTPLAASNAAWHI